MSRSGILRFHLGKSKVNVTWAQQVALDNIPVMLTLYQSVSMTLQKRVFESRQSPN